MNKIIKKITREIEYSTSRYLMSPEYLSLIITYQCNFRCQTCDIWKKKLDELSVEQWKKIIEQVRRIFPKETFIEINGGEPLIRKDLAIRLIQELKKNYQTVALNTNGFLLDEEKIIALEKAGLGIIKISLYSLNSQIHDQIRGRENAHQKAMEAIDLALKTKIQTEIGILITKENIDEIRPLIEYFSREKSQAKIILQPLEGIIEREDNKDSVTESLLPSKEKILELFGWLELAKIAQIKNSPRNLQLIKQFYLEPRKVLAYRCFAGQRGLIVYPDGQVALCFKGKKFGNLVAEKIEDLLKNKALFERKKIKTCQQHCRINGCNFSIGIKEFLVK